MACFSRINRAIEAPIGPTPYWMARIFFFTSVSVIASLRGHTLRILPASESLTIKEFPKAGNAKPAKQNDFVRLAHPEVQKWPLPRGFPCFPSTVDSRLWQNGGHIRMVVS